MFKGNPKRSPRFVDMPNIIRQQRIKETRNMIAKLDKADCCPSIVAGMRKRLAKLESETRITMAI